MLIKKQQHGSYIDFQLPKDMRHVMASKIVVSVK
jgi:hypothetical protein